MSQFPLSQFPLGRKAPLPADAVRAKVVFTVALGTDGKQISLVLRQEGEPCQDYIAIKEDSLVEIVLQGDQLFFSRAHDAITTKGPDLSFFYGDLEYDRYDEKLDRYKVVRFVARFNKGGKYGTVHGFNINVDLLQPGEDGPYWIGLSIDPDIKNPPPKRN
jgi:hypothetical protein